MLVLGNAAAKRPPGATDPERQKPPRA